MQPTDPLTKLRGLHLPEAISQWPSAPGWWFLALLCLITVIALTVLLQRRYRAGAFRRQALKEWQALHPLIEANSSQDYLQALNRLLKRTALAHYPKSQVASLTGERWLQFLDQSLDDNPFSRGQGKLLEEALYRREAPGESLIQLHQLAGLWIRRQRR